MSKVIIGSARIDEKGNLSGGSAGDQKQKTKPDYNGEVSLQNFYVHKKGWYVLRPKDRGVAAALGQAMQTACNNSNLGYDQANRLGVIKNGINTTTKTECDCSSLVRACIKHATGKDVGNFTTSTECAVLTASGLFEAKKAYKNGMALYIGDVLVTKTKGHTVIVTEPSYVKEEKAAEYYPRYIGKSDSIVDALTSLKVNASKENRKKIALANGMMVYSGSAKENLFLLALLKNGELKKP